MKLTILKPRLTALVTQRIPTQAGTDRLRGRAAVERRKRWLEANPLCVECDKQGRVTAATVPDHIVALVNGGSDTLDNLQSLCEEHHRIKTASDLGHRAKPTIGTDGWPE
jgi:5-methylcytosine-specific restriction endonuclease McrA